MAQADRDMQPVARDERGFTLIESMVAMGILATGVLSLAGAFTVGMRHLATSSANLVAREKARQAIESVHTARDTRVITWAQIRNVAAGGVFLDGASDLNAAGDDGLINTADDAAAGLEKLTDPGSDGLLGTADDIETPLSGYTRQVQIVDVNASLRQITVTIRYQVANQLRVYTLTTFVSSYS